jgi:flagellar hook-basal body complex protein FliE
MVQPVSSQYANLPRIDVPTPVTSAQISSAQAAPTQGNFQDLLAKSLGETAQMTNQAEQQTYEFMLGGDITQTEVFTSLKKADLALKTMVQFRNKFMQMYQEFQDIRF